jgi:hypothetical protein
MITYKIFGRRWIPNSNYRSHAEELDQTDSRRQAEYLVGEYRMSFGSSWEVWINEEEQEYSYV